MQLLFIAGVIIAISVLGGAIAWLFTPQFDDPGSAIWWAFLRLSDPGYLGDDEGALLRTVSTIVTVLGYVVFLGSLVAILTQWLNATMRKLESGLTPIALRDHILILGWTNRTPTIVQELMLSQERVRRFLSRRRIDKLRIVILAEEVTREMMVDLKETLGGRRHERHLILRSGTSLRLEHLRRVAYRTAAVIIVPGADFMLGGASSTDARVIKTLISLSSRDGSQRAAAPSVVAEIFDASKLPVAENAYHGGQIDVVASDTFVSRLIAQNVRHRGLSYVYSELLSHRSGNEVYVRRFPEWSGRRFCDLAGRGEHAIILGVVRPENGRFVPHLIPEDDWILEAEDRLVFLARSYEDCSLSAEPSDSEPLPEAARAPRSTEAGTRRILVLGWSHKVKALIDEFSGYAGEQFEIDVLSRVPVAERERAVGTALIAEQAGTVEQRASAAAPDAEDPHSNGARVHLSHVVGDYTLRDTLVAMGPGTYDNVVFLASDWLDSEEETDARSVLGYVILKAILDQTERRPELLIELMDPENARLFRHRSGEVIISPVILSHILAHVALRPELNAVFNELFGPGGAEFFFRPAAEFGLDGRAVTMRTIQHVVTGRDQVALGVRIRAEFERRGGGVYLNPAADRRWTLQPDDEIVVLTDT